MLVSDIFSGCGYTIFGKDINISTMAVHSRIIGEDCLFFSHKGRNSDYVRNAYDAVKNGASAVCTDDLSLARILGENVCAVYADDTHIAESIASGHLYPIRGDMKIIGVTGTNGKTSVCHMGKKLFSGLGRKSSYTGTLGTDISGYEDIFSNTTPTPSVFGKILSGAQDAGCEYVFSEVSSEGIMYHRTDNIPFHALIFTNLTPEHLNSHGDMENYYRTKKRVFTENECFYIINTDDPYGRRLYDELSGIRICAGSDEWCDIRIKDVSESISGIRFSLVYSGEKINISLPLYGSFTPLNIALAAAVMYVEGYSPKEAEEVINLTLRDAVAGRMERFLCGDASVFVDYAHTPDALEKALCSLKKMTSGRIITVFGCGGERDSSKREKMGRIACRYSDKVILTEDNSRNEVLSEIISGIYKGCDESMTLIYPDRRQAVTVGAKMLEAGDVMLLAGRGAEKYLYSSSGKRQFSDREFVKYLCRARE